MQSLRESILAMAALLFLSGITLAQQQGGGGEYQLDAELTRLNGATWLKEYSANEEYSMSIQVHPLSKKLTILWTRFLASGAQNSHYQTTALPYTPTAVSLGNSFGEFYVGGTSRFGRTRIQKYSYGEPSLVNGVLVDAALESTQVVVNLVSAPNSPTQDVYHIIRNRASNDLFVEFWSSNSIYSLDADTGALTQVVSSSASATGVLVSALLAMPHDVVYSREHISHGYLYYFSSRRPGYVGTEITILRDSDKDGVLDDALLVDSDDIVQLQLHDTDFFVD